ncbi:PAN domain-containing protein, putative, partial [Eimeria tenella]
MGRSAAAVALAGALVGSGALGQLSQGLSGAPLGAPGGPRSMECFEYGYDYFGWDLREVGGVASPSACMQECQSLKGCGFWSYNSFTRSCYLKSVGALVERRAAPGVVSGPRQCSFLSSSSSSSSSSCFEVGVDYPGHDVEKVEGRLVMNPLDCQRLCAGRPDCAFFSWKFSTRACYLKASAAPLARREDPDVTSGPRACRGPSGGPPSAADYPAAFDPRGAPPPCVQPATDYRGAPLKTLRARSAAACFMHCRGLQQCGLWTWSSSSHLCSLRAFPDPALKVQGQHTLDKVSATRDCVPVLP